MKPRRKKSSSREKSDHQSSTRLSCWPRVTIFRDKKSHGESNNDDSERNLSRFESTVVNDRNVVACDIVELLCDASNEERSTCPRISSSTEPEESADICSTCKDCAECQLRQQQDCAKIRKTEEEEEDHHHQDEELTEHLDYYEADVGGEMEASTTEEHEKAPILVDLTSEESKQTTWKQTILKRFGDTEEESSEMSGENVITSKSGVSSHAINTPPFPPILVNLY